MNKREFLEDYRKKYPKHYVKMIIKNNVEYFRKATQYCKNLELDSNSKILYHYAFSLNSIPKCLNCGKEISNFSVNGNWGYNKFCGKSCAGSHINIIEQRVKSRTISSTETLQKKREQILNMVCTKTRSEFESFIKALDSSNISNIEKTLISKYPDYYKFYLDNWDIPILEVIYLIKNNLNKPYCKNCNYPIRFKTYYKGYSNSCGNRECFSKQAGKSRREKIFQIWINRLKRKNIEVLSTKNQYVNDGNINLQCNVCNHVWSRKVHDTIHNGCPNCKIRHSTGEKEIVDYFNSFNIIENNKHLIYPKEVDIYFPDKKIAIEYNGNYWHSEGNGKGKKYHLNKTEECGKRGIQLLHIFESEWIYKQNIVKSLIHSKIGSTNRIYARKCKIMEIDSKTKNNFLNKTHLQGEDKSTVKIGLFLKDELVSVMTFCKSRFNKKYEWELSRFSSALNTTVIGGASKLLKYFIRNYNPNSIISYANRRYSNGNLYKQLGFDFLHNSSPNYFYIKGDCLDLYTRQAFQKHTLKNKLEIFNSDNSEWENMMNNGYDRIWDCGNSVWSWTK